MNIINVTIVYALPNIQYFYEVKLNLGSSVKDAILKSNIFNLIKNISLHHHSFGIYNKLVYLSSKIKDGDRIEIYRKLIIDPKERRRKNVFLLRKNKFD